MIHRTERHVRASLLILLALLGVLAGGAPAQAASPTPAQQLAWVIDASGRLPAPEAEVAAHISAATLTEIGGAAELNRALGEIGPLRVERVLARRARSIEALVRGPSGRSAARLDTNAAGLIARLSFAPYLPAPATWGALDARLRKLAPQVGFAAAEVTAGGGCRLLHGVHPDRARPLGSVFKLYVLGALGRAVAAREARWNERLRIRDAWKSLPSGSLRNAPAGRALRLRTYADAMISVSDNTAADHLLRRLGRRAVQAQLRRLGNRHARRNLPFLTTRELFALKGVGFPGAAQRYLGLSRGRRAKALKRIDRIPLTAIQPWTEPRQINRIEWFGSPADICRAYAGLARANARPGLSPIGAAMSLNDGGVALDRTRFPTVWFKGGSEPGVLTLTYLVRTADGRTLVSAVMLANPRSPIPDADTPELLALARGSLRLADRATARG